VANIEKNKSILHLGATWRWSEGQSQWHIKDICNYHNSRYTFCS